MDNEIAPVENVEVSAQNEPTDNSSSTDNVVESTTENSADATSAPEAPVEKMIPQSQVNRIAAREAREAEARVRAQYERQMAEANQAAQNVQGNLGGMTQFSPEQIRQVILQEAQAISQRQTVENIVNDWHGTMNAERDADPEFDRLYDELNIEAHPNLVYMMSSMDNKASIVKDMAKNPIKFSNILMLSQSSSPALAQRELQKISASIKANSDAQSKARTVAEPLSQLKSSNIGQGDGDKSVSDFRNMFRR